MSWAEHHNESERLASAAEAAYKTGNESQALELYISAAKAEQAALAELDKSKTRTLGITVVSAVSLFYKGRDYKSAQDLACLHLAEPSLPGFAVSDLRNLLQSVWGSEAIEAAGLKFAREDVFVSVKGGEVLTGGAPLDLVLRKVEEVRALFYRTVEFMMSRPLRRHGGPSLEIQDYFRPWLFQAPPGSYQFAVRLESPKQMELGVVEGHFPTSGEVTAKFLEIVSSTAKDPEGELNQIVPDTGYRNTFLKLTRNLAPTGKGFSELEIKSNARAGLGVLVLIPESRKALNQSIRNERVSSGTASEGRDVTLNGLLRAVHLDQDWIEITLAEDPTRHIRIEKAGEAIDDLVGPMVNHRVIVDAVESPTGKMLFKDIQPAE